MKKKRKLMLRIPRKYMWESTKLCTQVKLNILNTILENSKIFARSVCILIMHSPLIGHWSKEFQDDTGVPSSHGCKVIWSIGINNRGDKV